jgi:hypothetical protein
MKDIAVMLIRIISLDSSTTFISAMGKKRVGKIKTDE